MSKGSDQSFFYLSYYLSKAYPRYTLSGERCHYVGL